MSEQSPYPVDSRVEKLIGLVDAYCRGVGKESVEAVRAANEYDWPPKPGRHELHERMRHELREMKKLTDKLLRARDAHHA